MPLESLISSRQTLALVIATAIVWLSENTIEQLLPAHAEMPCDVSEHGGEGTDPERSVARNRYVVLTTGFGRKPHMAPGLTRNLIPEDSQGCC